MPCGHRFHEKCLLQWLRSHNTCPVCRFAVEASDAPRPTPLSAVLQNWHERMRAESQAGAAMAAARVERFLEYQLDAFPGQIVSGTRERPFATSSWDSV